MDGASEGGRRGNGKILRAECDVRDRVMESIAETDQDQHKKLPKDTNACKGIHV